MVGPDPAHRGAPALGQPVVHGTWSLNHHWMTATVEVMREPFRHDMALTFQCREPAHLFSQQAVPKQAGSKHKTAAVGSALLSGVLRCT